MLKAGWISLVLGILALLGSFSSRSSEAIGPALIFIAVGAILISIANKINSKKGDSGELIEILETIDTVASALEELIDNADIDDSDSLIIQPDTSWQNKKQVDISNLGPRQITCSNCGASIMVAAGGSAECEYCGSFVQDENVQIKY